MTKREAYLALRAASGLDAEQFAEQFGNSPGAVYGWDRWASGVSGHRPPSRFTLGRLSNFAAIVGCPAEVWSALWPPDMAEKGA